MAEYEKKVRDVLSRHTASQHEYFIGVFIKGGSAFKNINDNIRIKEKLH
jgi:hypothetical protein